MALSPLKRFAKFLEESERSPLTITNYQSDLAGFARWFKETNGDALHPKKVTSTDLREYKQYLIVQKELKPSSVNRKLAALKSFLNWAAGTGLMKNGRIPRMPRGLREERRGPRWLNKREQSRLLRSVERLGPSRDIAIINLLLNTGLRVRELCSLVWKDVKITERKGTLTVRSGKGRKRREIPLNKDAREALLTVGYRKNAGKRKAIFAGQRGPMTPRGIHSMFKYYAEVARLQDVSPHSLRHTFCKNLVNAGVGLEKVAALTGHESLETTRRYLEPSLQDLQGAVDLIGEEE